MDWEDERENFGDVTQAVLEEHFPGFGKLVLQREIVTPADIERVMGLSEGNIFMGEFLAPQMYFFRPAPGWSQYATPIDGYYQCGSLYRPRRLRDRLARVGSPASGSSATGRGRADRSAAHGERLPPWASGARGATSSRRT